MKKYWLYLEPFTFIFKGDNKYLIYNSLNGKMALFSDPTSLNYISKLDEQYSGYCIVITEQELNDLVLKNLINDIQKKVKQITLNELNKDVFNYVDLKNRIILEINSYIIELTGRRPIIMPMILETKSRN